jgi:hypothetical protein
MTWVLIVVVLAALGGLLGWASIRQRRHAGDSTMDQVKSERHRRGDVGGGYSG